MENMHSLLKRQLRKHIGNTLPDFPGWDAFIQQVNEAYKEFDVDRNMLERVLDISSQELFEANSQLRAILEAFPDAFLLLDSQGIILELKAGSSTRLHMTPEQLIGYHIEVIHPDFVSAIKQLLQKEEMTTIEFTLQLPDEKRYLEARLLPVPIDHIFVALRDITERRLMEEQLRYLSMHDALTGLYNRSYFSLETSHLEKQSRRSIALIISDIDGLKLVNDTLGHEAGDALLIKAARILKNSLRDFDFVARIGGDEFAAILCDCDEAGVKSAVKRLKDNIAAINSQNPGIPLSLSLGYAVRLGSSKSLDELFKEADDNMYLEKHQHRQHYCTQLISNLLGSIGEKGFSYQEQIEQTQELALLIAEALNLSPTEKTNLKLLVQYRDIGLIEIADDLYFKKEQITAQEHLAIERHPEIGYRIATLSPELMPIADLILKHHESWDGQGYPYGLSGENIPLECRILALANAYTTMINHHPPSEKAMSHEEAIAEIKQKAGTQFDPELSRLFLSELEKKKLADAAASAEG